MLATLSSKLIAGLAALAVLAGLGWWISNLYDSRAAARAALDTAVKANATNQATIDRLESDQVIAQAIAIADAGERSRIEQERDELKAAAGDGSCPGLDALIEKRRQQRGGQ